MSTLKETLPILDKGVPAVTGKLESVASHAAEFEGTVRDLLSSLSEKEDQARELLTRVTGALDGLENGAGEHRQAVARALEAAAAAVQEAIGALTDGEGD